MTNKAPETEMGTSTRIAAPTARVQPFSAWCRRTPRPRVSQIRLAGFVGFHMDDIVLLLFCRVLA